MRFCDTCLLSKTFPYKANAVGRQGARADAYRTSWCFCEIRLRQWGRGKGNRLGFRREAGFLDMLHLGGP